MLWNNKVPNVNNVSSSRFGEKWSILTVQNIRHRKYYRHLPDIEMKPILPNSHIKCLNPSLTVLLFIYISFVTGMHLREINKNWSVLTLNYLFSVLHEKSILPIPYFQCILVSKLESLWIKRKVSLWLQMICWRWLAIVFCFVCHPQIWILDQNIKETRHHSCWLQTKDRWEIRHKNST